MLAFELGTREFGQDVCSYVFSSWDIPNMYSVKTRLCDVTDQVIVLEENCVFYLKFVVEVANIKLGICFAY